MGGCGVLGAEGGEMRAEARAVLLFGLWRVHARQEVRGRRLYSSCEAPTYRRVRERDRVRRSSAQRVAAVGRGRDCGLQPRFRAPVRIRRCQGL